MQISILSQAFQTPNAGWSSLIQAQLDSLKASYAYTRSDIYITVTYALLPTEKFFMLNEQFVHSVGNSTKKHIYFHSYLEEINSKIVPNNLTW